MHLSLTNSNCDLQLHRLSKAIDHRLNVVHAHLSWSVAKEDHSIQVSRWDHGQQRQPDRADCASARFPVQPVYAGLMLMRFPPMLRLCFCRKASTHNITACMGMKGIEHESSNQTRSGWQYHFYR